MKKILIYRMGFLGDTLAAVPAVWAVKKNFPEARLFFLSQKQSGSRVLPAEIFNGSDFFDGFLFHSVDSRWWGKWLGPFKLLGLLAKLRIEKFDSVIYLPLSNRSARLIKRDKRFFSLAGIQDVIGMEKPVEMPVKKTGEPLSLVPHEADIQLSILGNAGLEVPSPGNGITDLRLNPQEKASLDSLLSTLPLDAGRPWLGIGPGAKQPVNIWPAERYQEVVRRMIEKYNVWPVVFGGSEDRELGEKLVRAWGCGYNLSGLLTVRLSAVALSRCRLHLGNDTGTIHLAAAVGTHCLAVYSSHDWPGLWFPYGQGHKVFRTPIECEGCLLGECIEKKMECILSIQVDEVAGACDRKWAEPSKKNQ